MGSFFGVDGVDGGVGDDSEILECHVDPLLGLPVGESERLPVRVWVLIKDADPALAPSIVKGVKLLPDRHLLEVAHELSKEVVGVLEENGFV